MNQEQVIKKLKEEIKNIKLESIVSHIAFDMSIQTFDKSGNFEQISNKTSLISPFRQYMYLINLLLSRDTDGEEEDTSEKLKIIKELLDEASMGYAMQFFPKSPQEFEEWDDDKKHKYEVVMPVFMEYFNTSDLRYPEQVRERILRLFSKYDAHIKKDFNNSTQELLELLDYIEETLEQQIDYAAASTVALNGKVMDSLTMLSKGLSIENIKDFMFGDATEFDHATKNMFKIDISNFIEKFGSDRVDGFLQKFSCYIECREFSYFTDPNIFLIKPIIYDRQSTYFIAPIQRQIINAVEEQLYQFCNSKFGAKFTRHRDLSAEERTISVFEKLFESNYSIYTSVYESNDSQNEHDILIIHKDKCLICEVKAKRIREPFRDPERAYTRILQEFRSDSGIQHAYNQALSLKRHILNGSKCNLYTKSGDLLVEIERDKLSEIYCLCITDSNFAILASRLDLLLEKDENEPYPFATSIDNLESIITTFQYLKKDYNDFYNYLDQRNLFHEKLHVSDELEIAGAFLSNGGLDKIEGIKSADKLFLTPDNADIFDQVYYRSHGYDIDIATKKTETIDTFMSFNKPHGCSLKSKVKSKSKRQMANKSKKRNRNKK